jgi:hypothetical protein
MFLWMRTFLQRLRSMWYLGYFIIIRNIGNNQKTLYPSDSLTIPRVMETLLRTLYIFLLEEVGVRLVYLVVSNNNNTYQGSRMCAGYHLALLELKILAIYVCQFYYWKCSFPPGKEPVRISNNLVIHPLGLISNRQCFLPFP